MANQTVTTCHQYQTFTGWDFWNLHKTEWRICRFSTGIFSHNSSHVLIGCFKWKQTKIFKTCQNLIKSFQELQQYDAQHFKLEVKLCIIFHCNHTVAYFIIQLTLYLPFPFSNHYIYSVVCFKSLRVLIKFIVGDEPCHIPPQDRLDQYSCERDALVDPGAWHGSFVSESSQCFIINS